MSWIRFTIFSAVLLAVPSGSVLAHRDMIFTIANDGTLKEVPDTYQPARVIYDPTSNPPEAKIEVSGFSLTLPLCLSRLFVLPEGEQIRAVGSWYHTRSTLPPYLSVELRQKTKPGDDALFEGYALLFSLETAELIEIREWRLVGTGGQGKRIETASICSESERDALKPRPDA